MKRLSTRISLHLHVQAEHNAARWKFCLLLISALLCSIERWLYWKQRVCAQSFLRPVILTLSICQILRIGKFRNSAFALISIIKRQPSLNNEYIYHSYGYVSTFWALRAPQRVWSPGTEYRKRSTACCTTRGWQSRCSRWLHCTWQSTRCWRSRGNCFIFTMYSMWCRRQSRETSCIA